MLNIMETKELSFTYPQGTIALEGIDISVRKGEFLGILGSNGSGKTTLLKILNGLLKATKGEVFLEGENIRGIHKDLFFRRVCTCFQNPDDQLFSPTVSEDIAFGPVNMGLTKDDVYMRVQNALEAVDMLDFFDRPIHNLSFGEKKRVCLAGVLAMGSQVMLLDECTSCLDPMGVNSIMQLLRKLNKEKGITMVMSTHSVDLVPLFIDRVIVLNKGKVISEGSPKEVFSKTEALRLAKLRLPRIGHLFEILNKKDGLGLGDFPLTIGEARQTIKKITLKSLIL